jgi:hypothetical protein
MVRFFVRQLAHQTLSASLDGLDTDARRVRETDLDTHPEGT